MRGGERKFRVSRPDQNPHLKHATFKSKLSTAVDHALTLICIHGNITGKAHLNFLAVDRDGWFTEPSKPPGDPGVV